VPLSPQHTRQRAAPLHHGPSIPPLCHTERPNPAQQHLHVSLYKFHFRYNVQQWYKRNLNGTFICNRGIFISHTSPDRRTHLRYLRSNCPNLEMKIKTENLKKWPYRVFAPCLSDGGPHFLLHYTLLHIFKSWMLPHLLFKWKHVLWDWTLIHNRIIKSLLISFTTYYFKCHIPLFICCYILQYSFLRSYLLF